MAKPDSRRIKTCLSNLKKADWLGTARRWWPDFLFHVTDIQNAVSVLRMGALLSRHEAENLDVMTTDNASPGVIARTDEKWRDYVRLYFRPRTPTQYRNEGIRSTNRIELNAHCPVPIFFLFDSFSILSRDDSRFSYGNLARKNSQVYGSASYFENIPFQSVYHEGRIESGEGGPDIVFHRNAEVIVPKRLELNALRLVACRSQAEYETLLHLIPPPVRRKWSRQIGVFPKLDLFRNEWTFVEQVDRTASAIVFHFNPNNSAPSPFQASLTITDTGTLRTLGSWERNDFSADQPLRLSLQEIGSPTDYYVSLKLNGHLAYADRYQHLDDLPW